jgi:hypothetical protein
MITWRGIEKNEASQKFARRGEPRTAAAATNSNRRRIRTGAVATSSVQRPPHLRTNVPSRARNVVTLSSFTDARSSNRTVSNQRRGD